MFSGKHVERRDDLVLENLLLVINVVQEKVQRGDALRQAAFEPFPFGGGNDARQKIEWEDFLRTRRIAIDVERHALPEKRKVQGLTFEFELPWGQ